MIVSNEININCNIDSVLKLIKSPRNLEKFHPFCKKNVVKRWDSENSIDYVHYHSGKIYKRKFIKWNDDGYILEIFDHVKTATIKWTAKPSSNGSIVTIDANLILPFKNKYFRKLAFNLYIKYMIGRYLNNVLMGLKYFLETGVIVKKNHFGQHSWYS